MAAIDLEQVKKFYIERRIIQFPGKADDDSINAFRRDLRILDAVSTDPIMVIFHSDGGKVAQALYAYDDIRTCRCEVIGIVFGECCSAAVNVLQACTKRLATPHSRLFVHSMRTDLKIKVDGKTEGEQYERHMKYTRAVDAKALAILCERTGRSPEEIRALYEEGDVMNQPFFADRAKREGLIDEIVDDATLKLLLPYPLPASEGAAVTAEH